MITNASYRYLLSLNRNVLIIIAIICSALQKLTYSEQHRTKQLIFHQSKVFTFWFSSIFMFMKFNLSSITFCNNFFHHLTSSTYVQSKVVVQKCRSKIYLMLPNILRGKFLKYDTKFRPSVTLSISETVNFVLWWIFILNKSVSLYQLLYSLILTEWLTL